MIIRDTTIPVFDEQGRLLEWITFITVLAVASESAELAHR